MACSAAVSLQQLARSTPPVVGVAAVVVARHDAIEDREAAVCAFVRRVVVDDVHHHAQAQAVQRLVHGAHFSDARRPGWISGVAAFRHVVEHRVVAPVEAVQVGYGGNDAACFVGGRVEGLELLQDRGGVADVAGAELLVGVVQAAQLEDRAVQVHLLRRVFVDRTDVEGGQHVEVGKACLGQRFQVVHRRRIGGCEGKELAAMRRWRAVVAGAEVADVAFVDNGALRVAGGRNRVRLPALRLQIRIVQVRELRRQRTGIGAHRVRVAGFAREHLHLARVIGSDDVAVVAPIPIAAAQTPDAGIRIQVHVPIGAEHQGAIGPSVVEAQLNVLRGGRPDRRGDGTACIDGP